MSSSALVKRFEADLLNEAKIPGGKLDVDKLDLLVREARIRWNIIKSREGEDYVRGILGRETGALGSSFDSSRRIANWMLNMLDSLGSMARESNRTNFPNPGPLHRGN